MAKFHSFLMAEQYSYSIVYISHIFFIHSSVDGHLGCFRILALINNASMNIGVHVYFQINVLFSSDVYAGVGLLNYTVVLFLVFVKSQYSFTQWLQDRASIFLDKPLSLAGILN